jgi:6-pyruvoyltetrahydropterin/6-carboxytetrahydropterin synthase
VYLTISKRFAFSASVRLARRDWAAERNLQLYGPASQGDYGHGYNYVATFVFHGPVSDDTGMMINVTEIKARIGAMIDQRYDHKFLNVDTPPFTAIVPTPEQLAAHLLSEAVPLFHDLEARPVACHLQDTANSAAIAYADGRLERELWISFSAARRTCSPHLSDEENEHLFGIAARKGGHGHSYRLRVVASGNLDSDTGALIPYGEWSGTLASLHETLDHKNLSTDIPDLRNLPTTTESLARYVFTYLDDFLPVDRVVLYETPDFFSEYRRGGQSTLTASATFYAAHRLYASALSYEENVRVFGKCTNQAGHGHEYRVEATIGGEYDERTGTLARLQDFQNALDTSVQPWKYRHLDVETDDFRASPSTGENIVTRLWSRLDPLLSGPLIRLRLWETPNNRFTLRRTRPTPPNLSADQEH